MHHTEERRDLAAAFRWTARENMHEGIVNHYSLAVCEGEPKYLLSPDGKYWPRMCVNIS